MPGKNKKNKQQQQAEVGQVEKEEDAPKTENSNIDLIPQTPVQESSQSESNNNAHKNQQLSQETLTQHSTVTETQNNNTQEEQKPQLQPVTSELPVQQQTNQIPEVAETQKQSNNQFEIHEKVGPVEENHQNDETQLESRNKIQNIPMEIKTEEIQKESELIQEHELNESKLVQPQPIVASEVPVAQEKIIINEIDPKVSHVLQKPEQSFVEIKQSTESIQPENLQPEQQKVNILKSYHSSEDDQSKIQPEFHQVQNAKQVQALVVVNHSQPFVEQEIPRIIKNQKEQNSQKLNERQAGWVKLQQKQVEPILKSPLPVSTSTNQIPQVVPLVKENLQYTNNLPIIQKQRISEIPSPQVEKGQQNDQKKLKKQVSSDSPIKKIVIATVAAGIFAGACVFGKADKRIAAGGSIASFIAAYFVQN